MYKPGFGVVTSVVAALCAIGVVTHVLKPHIPPLKANRMSNEKFDFMRQGQHQAVDWKPVTRATMAEARRAGRPILLVIGTPSSPVGIFLDNETFTDRDVATYLHRNFTCIRIDGAAMPQWINAFLPFSRLRYRVQPDLQIWALDPTGVPFDFVARSLADQPFNADAILPVLIDFRRGFERLGTRGRVPDGGMQSDDMKAMAGLTPTAVPFGTYNQSLRESLDFRSGGFGQQGLMTTSPLALRYLLDIGDLDRMQKMFDAVLRSPKVDMLDGGFFHTVANPPTGRYVEFEKRPVENAEAMLALAMADAVKPDAEMRSQVDAIWSYLAKFGRDGDGFVSGQVAEEQPRHRSERYSFASVRLRDTLGPDLRNWAIANLGLDVAKYPQATPFRATDAARGTAMEQVIEALRKAPGPPPQTVEPGLADGSLTCVARAIQTARILGDTDRLKEAIDWLEALEPLRDDNDVLGRLADEPVANGYLGDYLAYADARLQDFLATGRVRSFETGLGVLRQARITFGGLRNGVFYLNRPDIPLALPNTGMPEIADNLHEACTARAIRLLLAYGRLLGNAPEGVQMCEQARTAVALFGGLASSGGPMTAGYFCAAAESMDDGFAVVVGPEAQAGADALARLLPTRLVAPAFGPARPDLQGRKPGVYVVQGAIRGPFTVAQAAKELKPSFDIGLP